MIPAGFLEDLHALLSIPSVAAWNRPDEMERAADWLIRRLRRAGLESCRLEGPANAPPYVFAESRQRAGLPTLLVYGHYDVQPAKREDGWLSDPFVPELRHGRVYARGATDQKMNLLLPLYAMETLGQQIACNVKVFLEGEEEVLSPNLSATLAQYRSLLQADVVISSDGWQATPDRGDLRLGLRGFCALEVTVTGATKDLHSGIWGGAAPDPTLALSQMLAALAGQLPPAAPPQTAEVRVAMEGFDSADWQARSGLATMAADAPVRTGLMPSLVIHAIEAGNFGGGLSTVIPPSARARLSCRLVPGQDPETMLHRMEAALRGTFAASGMVGGLSLTVEQLPGRALPYRLAADHPAQAACAAALTAIDGRPPRMSYSGGSIPLPGEILSQLGLQTVIFGFGLPDENMHGPNEFCRLTDIVRGLACWRYLLRNPPRHDGTLPLVTAAPGSRS